MHNWIPGLGPGEYPASRKRAEIVTAALREAVEQERQRRKATRMFNRIARSDRQLRDLDETRRVALMALGFDTPNEKFCEIIATVISAVVYHSHLRTPAEGRELLERLYAGEDCSTQLRALINEVCERLGDDDLFYLT
jgi:hypothetical protein